MKASLSEKLPFCSYLDAEHPPLCTDSHGDFICTLSLSSMLGFAASAAVLLKYGGNAFFLPLAFIVCFSTLDTTEMFLS